MLLCILIHTPITENHHKLTKNQIVACKKMMINSIKRVLNEENYQEKTTMKKASNLILHQVNQLTDLTSMLNAELQEQINVVLRDIEETSLRLVHSLIDILKNSLNIKLI